MIDIGEDYLLSEEAAGLFLNEISTNYHHSAGNASKMFISAYNITNNDQFILASKSIATILGTDIKTIKEIVQESKDDAKSGIIDQTLFSPAAIDAMDRAKKMYKTELSPIRYRSKIDSLIQWHGLESITQQIMAYMMD